jgi:carbon-monoxide dehydrogenase small subunit
MIRITVNGASVSASAEPRTHLADFLRESLLLTGTHLGCEHGVCGACTVLIDGAPARACIAFAASCEGARVDTIEGLEHDPIMVRLRAAFTAEHALQCGYCTPGMLVTARDIVLRLPDADEARVRLELAGNLCRCTGYVGIVRATVRVLAEAPAPAVAVPPPLPHATFATAEPAAATELPSAQGLAQRVRIAAPLEAVWAAVQNPTLIAECVPGARLTEQDGQNIAGELALALGPMRARFAGRAEIIFGPGHLARVRGDGRDALSGTRLAADATVALQGDGDATVMVLEVRYSLRGPLAHFARGAVVAALAAEIAETVAANLAARLTGTAPPVTRRMGLGRLVVSVLRRWLFNLNM